MWWLGWIHEEKHNKYLIKSKMAPIFHKLSDGSICAQYKCKVFYGLIDKLMDEIEGNYSPSGYIQSISHQGLGKDVDLKNVTFFLNWSYLDDNDKKTM